MTTEGCFWRTAEAQETRTVISCLLIFAHSEVSRLVILISSQKLFHFLCRFDISLHKDSQMLEIKKVRLMFLIDVKWLLLAVVNIFHHFNFLNESCVTAVLINTAVVFTLKIRIYSYILLYFIAFVSSQCGRYQ